MYYVVFVVLFFSTSTVGTDEDKVKDNVSKRESLQQLIHLHLFTRKNVNTSVVLTKVKALNTTQFNPRLKTVFIFHGFASSMQNSWVLKMKNELLIKEDLNVCVLDWAHAVHPPDYVTAVLNIPVVGKMMMQQISRMKELGLHLDDLHLIGHSLGAHLAGDIGRRFNGSVGRITGLDPAAHLFEEQSKNERLDPSDAEFVDVIHSDVARVTLPFGGFGILQPLGHVDFYPNGGLVQPGCNDKYTGVFPTGGVECSHRRAAEYFMNSINTMSPCLSQGCTGYKSFLNHQCSQCSNTSCNVMGYLASPLKGLGRMYLQTRSKPPYCDFYNRNLTECRMCPPVFDPKEIGHAPYGQGVSWTSQSFLILLCCVLSVFIR
ncbi:pancreatic lipase-related protein 2-like [Physella acuta]|uniref:pancreatic lipase-related protein 2-like n=1 Tax=Physella acuta TaxID=109671 RepID=UPI0027DE9237|nr:pancreatic lipase-related protein 2-like [Physella acuta]